MICLESSFSWYITIFSLQFLSIVHQNLNFPFVFLPPLPLKFSRAYYLYLDYSISHNWLSSADFWSFYYLKSIFWVIPEWAELLIMANVHWPSSTDCNYNCNMKHVHIVSDYFSKRTFHDRTVRKYIVMTTSERMAHCYLNDLIKNDYGCYTTWCYVLPLYKDIFWNDVFSIPDSSPWYKVCWCNPHP